jgi:hypothetical protein
VWSEMATMTCARVEEMAPGFVLGALELDEMAAVREHLESCPQPHLELNEMAEVMPALAIAPEPLEPPAWLRESVMAAAQADLAARRRIVRPFQIALARTETEPEAEVDQRARVIALPRLRPSRRRIASAWMARAAAAVVVVGLAAYSLVVQGDLNRALQDQERAKTVLNVIGQPGSRSVSLADIGGTGAGGTAALLPSGHLVVWLNHLPQTHGDQIYSVWLAGDTGEPVKLGSFYPGGDGTGFLEVDNVPTTATLQIVVRLEPDLNATAPTGQPILLGVLAR